MIHVCYVTNDGYCSHAAVSAVSVFENNRNDDVCVHILAENISEESRRRLEAAADPYPRGQIDIIDCTGYVERIQKEYAPQGWKGTCNAYLYVFTEELFPDIDRLLWIDCDMVVLSSLHELWQTDLEGKLTGAVLDVPVFLSMAPDDPFWQSHFYFNGGFLLLNLKEYRARHMDAVLQERLRRDGARFRYPDQTLLNLEFPEEDVVHLDLRYDFPAGISDRSYRWAASEPAGKAHLYRGGIRTGPEECGHPPLYRRLLPQQTLVYGLQGVGRTVLPLLSLHFSLCRYSHEDLCGKPEGCRAGTAVYPCL